MIGPQTVKRDYTRSQLTEAQQQQRLRGISASDVPVILGLSKYKTPHQLWLEKTGRKEKQWDEEGTRFAEWGNRLESLIAQAYLDSQPAGTTLFPGQTLTHERHEWAMATPDFEVQGPEGKNWLLECKNRNAWAQGWGPSGSQEIPGDVGAQVRWQMFVSGADRVDVAVLIGGNDFRVYPMMKDVEAEQGLYALVRDWYIDHMELGVEPKQTPAEGAGWVTVDGKKERKPLELDAGSSTSRVWEAKARDFNAAKAALDMWEEKSAALRNGIIAEMKQHKSVIGEWGSVTVGVREGRESIDYKAALDKLAGVYRIPLEVVRQEVAAATKRGQPYATVTVKLNDEKKKKAA